MIVKRPELKRKEEKQNKKQKDKATTELNKIALGREIILKIGTVLPSISQH